MTGRRDNGRVDTAIEIPLETGLARGVFFGLLFVAPFWLAVIAFILAA